MLCSPCPFPVSFVLERLSYTSSDDVIIVMVLTIVMVDGVLAVDM